MYTHKGRNTHAHSHSLAQTCAEHPQMRIHENDKFISKSAICFAAIATSAPKTARLLNKIGFWLDAHLRRCCASLGRTMWVCVRVFVFVCLCVRVVPTQCSSGRTLCQYLFRLHQELQNHSPPPSCLRQASGAPELACFRGKQRMGRAGWLQPHSASPFTVAASPPSVLPCQHAACLRRRHRIPVQTDSQVRGSAITAHP